jgi:hypothetical protein
VQGMLQQQIPAVSVVVSKVDIIVMGMKQLHCCEEGMCYT